MNFNIFGAGGTSKRQPIPTEIYKSVRVMRDDLNEIEGKPHEPIPGGAEEVATHAGNPFLDEAVASAEPMPVASQGTAPKYMRKWFMIGGAMLSVAVIAGGLAYFVFRDEEPSPDMMAPEQLAVEIPAAGGSSSTQQPEVDLAQKTQAFSITNPNYLTIDPESAQATPSGIRAILAETSRKVGEISPSEPVEFLIRDANNNPIAFSRFAYLLGLSIPQETLSLIDEPFSVYFAPGNGTGVRMAILLETKDYAGVMDAVASGESLLPSWFSGVLYPGGVTVPATVEFRSGLYGTVSTRFASVDDVSGYSFDYAFFEKRWVIGTSKDSFRAVLAKVAQTAKK